MLELRTPVRARGFGHPDEPVELAADEFFVLNDDPDNTLDSRLDGPEHGRNYLGVVDVVFWPPSRWRILP